jgi:hypothetical protein
MLHQQKAGLSFSGTCQSPYGRVRKLLLYPAELAANQYLRSAFTSYFVSLSRPCKNDSSTMNASPTTFAPIFSASPAADCAVPPVAIRSSTTQYALTGLYGVLMDFQATRSILQLVFRSKTGGRELARFAIMTIHSWMTGHVAGAVNPLVH